MRIEYTCTTCTMCLKSLFTFSKIIAGHTILNKYILHVSRKKNKCCLKWTILFYYKEAAAFFASDVLLVVWKLPKCYILLECFMNNINGTNFLHKMCISTINVSPVTIEPKIIENSKRFKTNDELINQNGQKYSENRSRNHSLHGRDTFQIICKIL